MKQFGKAAKHGMTLAVSFWDDMATKIEYYIDRRKIDLKAIDKIEYNINVLISTENDEVRAKISSRTKMMWTIETNPDRFQQDQLPQFDCPRNSTDRDCSRSECCP